jgi:hypothetical protein
MRGNRMGMVVLTAGALILGLSRVGGLPADISAIALDPRALLPHDAGIGMSEGTTRFHGDIARPIGRMM